MRIISLFLLSFFFVLSPQVVRADSHAARPEIQLLQSSTTWKNQSGSVASISFNPTSDPSTYIVSGTYVNNAAGFKCQGTPYSLLGYYYVNTQTISFSVAWSNSTEDCQSVTGWTGYINIGTSPIQMLTNWNLAYSSTSGPVISQGKDVFTMSNTITSTSLVSE